MPRRCTQTKLPEWRANKPRTWGDVSSFGPLYWMIRSTVRAAQSGLNAEHFCGKATILLASDLQSKLKDFISPIITGDGASRSSNGEIPRLEFHINGCALHIFGAIT